jgi:hypothetical protein
MGPMRQRWVAEETTMIQIFVEACGQVVARPPHEVARSRVQIFNESDHVYDGLGREAIDRGGPDMPYCYPGEHRRQPFALSNVGVMPGQVVLDDLDRAVASANRTGTSAAIARRPSRRGFCSQDRLRGKSSTSSQSALRHQGSPGSSTFQSTRFARMSETGWRSWEPVPARISSRSSFAITEASPHKVRRTWVHSVLVQLAIPPKPCRVTRA